MSNYHFLLTSLPEISNLLSVSMETGDIGLSDNELKSHIIDHILNELKSFEDIDLFNALRLKYDNKCLIKLLENHDDKDFVNNDFSVFSKDDLSILIKEIKDNLFTDNNKFPRYIVNFVIDFLDSKKIYKNSSFEISWEDELNFRYFNYIKENYFSKNPFIYSYLLFDYNLRNILANDNCKIFDKKQSKNLILVDDLSIEIVNDDIPVSQLISNFNDLSIIDKELAIDKLRISFINDKIEYSYFKIENILAYFLHLDIARRWMFLNKDAGQKMINGVINE